MKQHWLLVFCIILCCAGESWGKSDLLSGDYAALRYCQTAPNVYVAIIWPRGTSATHLVIDRLNGIGEVKYVKQLHYTKKQLFSLYRTLHMKMSHQSAKRYFSNYVAQYPNNTLLSCVGIVFHTNAPLEEIIAVKKSIRAHIGHSYYSLHINDNCYPETEQAATFIFKEEDYVS